MQDPSGSALSLAGDLSACPGSAAGAAPPESGGVSARLLRLRELLRAVQKQQHPRGA